MEQFAGRGVGGLFAKRMDEAALFALVTRGRDATPTCALIPSERMFSRRVAGFVGKARKFGARLRG